MPQSFSFPALDLEGLRRRRHTRATLRILKRMIDEAEHAGDSAPACLQPRPREAAFAAWTAVLLAGLWLTLRHAGRFF